MLQALSWSQLNLASVQSHLCLPPYLPLLPPACLPACRFQGQGAGGAPQAAASAGVACSCCMRLDRLAVIDAASCSMLCIARVAACLPSAHQPDHPRPTLAFLNTEHVLTHHPLAAALVCPAPGAGQGDVCGGAADQRQQPGPLSHLLLCPSAARRHLPYTGQVGGRWSLV